MDGSEIPKDFDLSRINVPTSFHYSPIDKFTNPTDVNRLIQKLNHTIAFIQTVDTHNHLDFVWGKYTTTIVYSKILEFFAKYQWILFIYCSTIYSGNNKYDIDRITEWLWIVNTKRASSNNKCHIMYDEINGKIRVLINKNKTLHVPNWNFQYDSKIKWKWFIRLIISRFSTVSCFSIIENVYILFESMSKIMRHWQIYFGRFKNRMTYNYLYPFVHWTFTITQNNMISFNESFVKKKIAWFADEQTEKV